MGAVAGAALAVLSLLSILVPADVGGLTRLDLFLGVGLASPVSVPVGAYAENWTGGNQLARGWRGAIAPPGGPCRVEVPYCASGCQDGPEAPPTDAFDAPVAEELEDALVHRHQRNGSTSYSR